MSRLRIVWIAEDEQENIKRFDLSFHPAKEVIENQASIRLTNLARGGTYIGVNADLSEVLYVYCALSDEFIQILFARRATREEADAFFHHLRGSYENQ